MDPLPLWRSTGFISAERKPQGLSSECIIPVNLIQCWKVKLNELKGLVLMKICRLGETLMLGVLTQLEEWTNSFHLGRNVPELS